ncbi:MAG: hypothetical protein IPO90_09215 [Flavobacteriales bacterium]|nr:hypothetical protein [Flavobacteriales bacterium]
MKKVDVAINVYGKPAQTAVTLLSLIEHSGQWIDRIWFIEERRQPFDARFDELKNYLGDRLIHYRPWFWLSVRSRSLRLAYKVGPLRRSVRYQVAWERSKQPFLFITHNDVLHRGDVIGALLEHVGNHIAIGPVGQCWNCSASSAGLCSSEKFDKYRPGYQEWLRVSTQFKGARSEQYEWTMDHRKPWPLPECRLNEWSAMINLQVAKKVTMPVGPAVPFGASFGLDIGTQWFHDVMNMPLGAPGSKLGVKHFDTMPFALHAWASTTGGGHAALSHKATYDAGEALALQHLRTHYSNFPC